MKKLPISVGKMDDTFYVAGKKTSHVSLGDSHFSVSVEVIAAVKLNLVTQMTLAAKVANVLVGIEY